MLAVRQLFLGYLFLPIQGMGFFPMNIYLSLIRNCRQGALQAYDERETLNGAY
jgi:hypothetical protein